MHVEVRDLNKHFGDFHAVKDVSFDIAKGHLIGLLGPSGGGKTSILRMLAGLENPGSGEIRFHGKVVNHLPPQERGIGFVFQNYALFKHMTVFENIAFGLKVKKTPKAQIRDRVMELVELTGLKVSNSAIHISYLVGSVNVLLLPEHSPRSHSCYCWTNRSRPLMPRSVRNCVHGCVS